MPTKSNGEILYAIPSISLDSVSMGPCEATFEMQETLNEQEKEVFPRSMANINNWSSTINISPKSISRKKFKKRLMSRGMNRNEAEEICKHIGNMNGFISYDDINLYTLFISDSRAILGEIYCTYILRKIKGDNQ